MYLITNREIREQASGVEMLGPRPNREGPNELRVFWASGRGSNWQIELVPDRLGTADKPADWKCYIHSKDEDCFGTCLAAKDVLERVRSEKRHLLFFVHGFNNDVLDVLRRARSFETRYGVEAIVFSWPANGGGAKSVLSYKSDKRDAKASIGALDRALAKMGSYLNGFFEEARQSIADRLDKKLGKDSDRNSEKWETEFTRMSEKECGLTVNMALHSMGNYLFKHLVLSTASEGGGLLFDNIILAAADTNNLDHRAWVDRIRCRKRIYVTINENDHALGAARLKTGDDQLARLGHYPFRLDSDQAVYVDFTSAAWVRTTHSYFEGGAVRNDAVQKFLRGRFQRTRGGDWTALSGQPEHVRDSVEGLNFVPFSERRHF